MIHPNAELVPKLREFVEFLDPASIDEGRKSVLQTLITYGKEQLAKGEDIKLNFICTHNSRRSQFAQVWAQTAAACYNLPVYCYSGGVEITAFNPRAVKALEKVGFEIAGAGDLNPRYEVFFSRDRNPIQAFSKLYDDPENPTHSFAAVMTCSHADENCPFIPGAARRIALNYEDPKEFDGTSQESEQYEKRSHQIATEMFYAFSKMID